MRTRSLFRVRHTRACSVVSATVSLVLGVAVACSDGTGPAGSPATMQLVTGDSQTATVETPVTLPLVVSVLDSTSRPVPGVTVTFITSDSGSFGSKTATTDSLGHASTTFTPGKRAGHVIVSASVANIPSATFDETAAPAAPAAADKLSGDAQAAPAGSTLSTPFVIQILDGFGNPVPGVAVTWTASAGTFTQSDAVTDANGEAKAVLTLAGSAGAETVTAHVTGASDVVFTATAQ